MQLLYGRDKSDYKTLSKSPQLSEAAANVLTENYLGYEFVKNQEEYSDITKQPFSLAYCVTNLDGYLDKEMILVSKNGRNLKYTTPSRYAHARLFEIDENSFKDSFFDIFKYSFIDSENSEDYKGDDIDSYKGELIDLEQTEQLSKKALKSILDMLFDNYRTISKRIYIIIDGVGDNYNARSLDVIRQIYKNVPYFIRKLAGFVSYGSPNYSNRIKLVALSRENEKISSDLKVDLLNLDLGKIEEISSKESKYVAEYILDLDEDKKVEFFDLIDSKYKNTRLTIKDLYNICLSRKLWGESSDKSKMESWIHNIINYNELDEELFNKMLDSIEENLNDSIFDKYLHEILSKDSNICLEYLDSDKDLYNLLLFEDILSVDYDDLNLKINLNAKYIADWWEENIFPILKSKYEGQAIMSALEDEVTKFEKLDLQGENYKKLKKEIKQKAESLIKSEECEIGRYIVEEKEKLIVLCNEIEEIENLRELESQMNKIEDIYENLVYKINKRFLKNNVLYPKFREIVDSSLQNKEYDFFNLEAFLDRHQDLLGEEALNYMLYKKEKASYNLHQNLATQIQDIKDLKSLRVLQESLSIEDELSENKKTEEILVERFKDIIRSFSESEVNDIENIKLGIKIDRGLKNNYVNDHIEIRYLIRREIFLDLNDIRKTIQALNEAVEFIDKLEKDGLNVKHYMIFIRLGDDKKTYHIKAKYLNNLLNYIEKKQNKSFFSKPKVFMSKSLKQEYNDFNKENIDLLRKIDKYLKK